MYIPLSYYNELGDIEVISHHGQLHLFHLVLPNRDIVGHAVSDDGLSWETLPPAISTGNPGACDDDMIRTVSVTKKGRLFYMLYTACSRAEGGRVQMVALATSLDLISWDKYKNNPVSEASKPYYEKQLVPLKNVSWRDPKPYFQDGVYYCLINGRTNYGPFLRRGCIALVTSDDLIHWEVQKPLFAPMKYFDLECPQLYRIGNYYYIFASVMEDNSQRYWISKDLNGPYITPQNNKIIPEGSHYAGRVTTFQGKDIFCCWLRSKGDGPNPYGLFPFQGKELRYVPSPLEIHQNKDGTLVFHQYDNWKKYCCSNTEKLSSFDLEALIENTSASFEEVNMKLSVIEGIELVTTKKNAYQDFLIEGKIMLQGHLGGICFHVDEESGGYFIEMYPSQSTIKLIKHLKVSNVELMYDYFDYQIIQENVYQIDLPMEKAFALRHVKGEVEFSINGEVVLSTISTTRNTGKVGFFVESGTIRFEDLQITNMDAPNIT
ncbi:hypothetical protein [Aquibacillus albus]|uniref:beta-fructofuranosidase n=1 Tax=Aquibacillus albus TaxID=1168171 RepID=A0ABS2MWR9_9BACI|nr:beta-fructofuranosidase [Aquibacillus albus]